MFDTPAPTQPEGNKTADTMMVVGLLVIMLFFLLKSLGNFKKEGLRVSRPSKQKEKDSSDEAEDDDEE
ncbi:MAG: hypothetical protein WDW38_003774 [Sanguina aurantia]